MDAETKKPARRRSIDPASKQLAKVYAKAVFGAAEAEGRTGEVLEDLHALIAEVFDPHPALEAMLTSHRVAETESAGILDRVVGDRVSKTTLNFLKVLARHGRITCLRDVADELQSLHDAQRKHVRVFVETAAALPEDQAEQLKAEVVARLGLQPDLQRTVRPELLGGMVVRIGDTVYDGSVATQLERIREQLMHRSVHEIQSRRDRFSTSEGD